MARTSPNIVVTGTPGVGKTSHCEVLAERTGLRHLSVNQIIKDRGCHEGWDEEYQSWIVDEDKVCRLPRPQNGQANLTRTPARQLLDALEEEVKNGGCIIDWHACDLFPKRWVDLVVVLRCDSETLYDRLTTR